MNFFHIIVSCPDKENPSLRLVGPFSSQNNAIGKIEDLIEQAPEEDVIENELNDSQPWAIVCDEAGIPYVFTVVQDIEDLNSAIASIQG